MHTTVQEKKALIYLKKWGETMDVNEDSFIALWTQKVTSQVNIKAEFKSGKLVLHNYTKDYGITFSKGFAKNFSMKEPFFGKGSRWATRKHTMKTTHRLNSWYFEIFSTTLAITHENIYQQLSTSFYPWRCKTMRKVLYLLNTQVTSLLKDTLKEAYDAEKHHFQLELNDYCKVEMGPWLTWCYFSKNLSHLLGFPDRKMKGNQINAQREVDSLAHHSRQLHVRSNVIQPTAYGKHQRQILSDFLHKQQTLPMIEKHFHPIHYHPVARNNIEMVHVQLTDDEYKPISIQNAPTIVTLYFRQVK